MLGQKPESLVDSFLLSAMKAIGTFLKVKNVEALQKDLKNDMVNVELLDLAGSRCVVEVGFPPRVKRQGVAIMVGGAVLNVATFIGGNYLAKTFSGENDAADKKKERHDKAPSSILC